MQNDLDLKGLLAGLEALTPGWAGAMVAAFSARKLRYTDFGNDGAEQDADLVSAKWLADNLPAIRRHLSAVPDGEGELVEAAARRIAENHWSVDFEGTKEEYVESHWLYHVDDAKAALAASRLSQAGVRVKPLTWEQEEPNWWCSQPQAMIAGGYEVRITDSGKVRARRGPDDWFYFDGTADDAKAYWQADYETRIRSALSGDTP